MSGRVQGVFYRQSTANRALQLGLRGYARNLADGRVEVLVVGEPDRVAELLLWLWRGPPAARVTEVLVEELALDALAIPGGFERR